MATTRVKKIVQSDASVEGFLATLKTDAQRADCHKLADIMQRATGHPPVMWGTHLVGFGLYRYSLASGVQHEAPGIAFSPRGQNISLFHMDFHSGKNAALLERLGIYTTGKKCLYIARLADVDAGVLQELCTHSFRSAVVTNI